MNLYETLSFYLSIYRCIDDDLIDMNIEIYVMIMAPNKYFNLKFLQRCANIDQIIIIILVKMVKDVCVCVCVYGQKKDQKKKFELTIKLWPFINKRWWFVSHCVCVFDVMFWSSSSIDQNNDCIGGVCVCVCSVCILD